MFCGDLEVEQFYHRVMVSHIVVLQLMFRFMVFNTTINNTLLISWRSVYNGRVNEVPGENHRSVGRHCEVPGENHRSVVRHCEVPGENHRSVVRH